VLNSRIRAIIRNGHVNVTETIFKIASPRRPSDVRLSEGVLYPSDEQACLKRSSRPVFHSKYVVGLKISPDFGSWMTLIHLGRRWYFTRLSQLLILMIGLFSNIALAQAWKQGQASLLKNDFKSAQSQLTAALKKCRSKEEQGETYKYLGVAQYMAGQKQAATSSFQKAKAIHPSIQLTDAEVVDESVLPFFKGVGARPASGKPSTVAEGPKGNLTAGGGITKLKSKKTVLKVNCNVPSAQIKLDGIGYGGAGEEIEVSPGTVILTVSANGYADKAIKVTLDPQTTSSVDVSLEKKPEKPKPLPMKAAIPLPKTGGHLSANNSRIPKKRSGGDLFGEESATPIDYGPPPVAPNRGPISAPPAPSQPVMPPQGYGLQAAQPPYAQPQPPYAQPYAPPPQPYAQQPYAPPPQPYAQSPYAQPQPMYAPQQPAYPAYAPPQQPAYAPQQPYQQPAYGGYGQPPNPYAPPPSPYQPYVAAPVADPYGGYLGPPPESASSAAPPPPNIDSPSSSSGSGMPPPPRFGSSAGASKKGSKKESKSKSEGCSAFIRILPFGAGQFCYGSTIKGIFFLGSEVASLYFYNVNTTAATKYQATLDSINAEREAARPSVAQADQEAFDAETETKNSEGKATIAKTKQQAQYSALIFGGLWVGGVVDAFVNDFPGSSSAKKSKGRSRGNRPRILHSFNLDLRKAPMGTLAMDLPYDSSTLAHPFFDDSYEAANYFLGYTPTVDSRSKNLVHSLTLGMAWEL
jgi:PEGA domain